MAYTQYYRPSRAGYKGGRACEAPDSLQVWQRQSALWFNSACHRSLYSYQTRTALALAVQYPHIAVTYLPLACTGATIADGLFGSQRARECPPTKSGAKCSGKVNAQLTELREALTAAKRRQPDRKLDLVLLSVGANDINFSGLVADVIVDSATERALFRRTGVIGSVDDSRSAMTRDLPQGFAKLREALKPLVGDMSRVVYVSYANPTLATDGAPCPGGRAGFDIHPSFNAAAAAARRRLELRAERVPAAAEGAGAVPGRHPVPRSRRRPHDLRRCASGHLCQPRLLRARRKRSGIRPACFSANGDSFDPDIVTAASQPMLCGRSAGEYRAYLPRARWIRDANDSYFAAMTYPGGLPTSSSPPTSTTRPGAFSRRSMAARCIRPPRATPRWRMRPCRPRPRCCSSMRSPRCRSSRRRRWRRYRTCRSLRTCADLLPSPRAALRRVVGRGRGRGVCQRIRLPENLPKVLPENSRVRLLANLPRRPPPPTPPSHAQRRVEGGEKSIARRCLSNNQVLGVDLALPRRRRSRRRRGGRLLRRDRCLGGAFAPGAGFIAAACAGRYFATTAGSTCAIAVSGNRVQISSLPNSEMPR